MQWHTKHSSKTYMFLLKCLHDMNENVTHPLSCLEPSLIPSRMPKPRVRKYRFQNKRFFILENILKTKGFLFSKTYYRVSVKSIGQPFEVNCLVVLRNNHDLSDVNCWTTLQSNSSENLLLKFLSQPFSFFFHVMHSHLLL